MSSADLRDKLDGIAQPAKEDFLWHTQHASYKYIELRIGGVKCFHLKGLSREN
jgi:hypothetical protein